MKWHDTSTLVDHYVSSFRERDKIEGIVEEMKEGTGKTRSRNKSEETEENKNIPPLPLPAARIASLGQL